VKNKMQQYQSNKYHREIKMNIAPLMPSQRQQSFSVAGTLSAVKLLAASTCPGRQYVLDYKACNSKAKQVDKAYKIDNIIQCGTFHEIFTLKTDKNNEIFSHMYIAQNAKKFVIKYKILFHRKKRLLIICPESLIIHGLIRT
jgi:hypothetical protein